MKKIINRKVYDTDTADLICYNGILNTDGCTRSTTLYKTKKNNYFFVHQTMWQGEYDSINECDEVAAADFYENAIYSDMNFEDAFPSEKLEEA